MAPALTVNEKASIVNRQQRRLAARKLSTQTVLSAWTKDKFCLTELSSKAVISRFPSSKKKLRSLNAVDRAKIKSVRHATGTGPESASYELLFEKNFNRP